MTPPPRIARIVLVGEGERVLGALPPVRVATPWWHEAAPVVDAVRTAFGYDITILRLHAAEAAGPHGGAVTYVAQVRDLRGRSLAAHLEPWDGLLAEDSRRMAWARSGGPEKDLAWAASALRTRGHVSSGSPEQMRSWHLSSLWRIPLDDGGAWLKCVPPFFGHEGRLLAALGASGEPVPRLLAHEGHRMLLADVPGRDLHEIDPASARRLVVLLVAMQARWSDRVAELEALGATDFREAALGPAIGATVAGWGDALTRVDREALDRFVAGLDERFAAIAACGLRDTLVHGDFHPANARADGTDLVLLDWGDSGIGHPLLDQPAFLERLPAAWRADMRAVWSDAWRAEVPGADPDRAMPLLEPVAAARQAVILDRFVSSIEPAEAAYHRTDILRWLRRVAAHLRQNQGR